MSDDKSNYCNLGDRILTDQECLNWCQSPQNQPICDNLLLKYCRFNTKDKRCGCALPNEFYQDTGVLGPPYCVDSRCVGNPEAKKLWSQREASGCNIVNCVIDQVKFDLIKNQLENVDLSQYCGNKLPKVVENPANSPSNNLWIYFAIGSALIFLLLIIFIFI